MIGELLALQGLFEEVLSDQTLRRFKQNLQDIALRMLDAVPPLYNVIDFAIGPSGEVTSLPLHEVLSNTTRYFLLRSRYIASSPGFPLVLRQREIWLADTIC